MSENWDIYSAIAVLFLLFLLSNLYIFPRSFLPPSDKRIKPLDLMFGYTTQDVEYLFEALKSEGRATYKKNLWTLDFIYPIIYTLLLSLIFHVLLPYLPDYAWLKILPLFPIFFDYWRIIILQY